MFSRNKPGQIRAARGHRAYVIGDVHGRLDLLDQLLAQIHDELERRPAPKTLLIFVGDLIDRGPQSAQVIERLRTYRHDRVERICLLGNHEEVLVRILDGETSLIASWLGFGGKQTLTSYGLDPLLLTGKADEDALRMIRNAIPPEHVAFLKTFIDTFRFGDYAIVHAGVRPGVALNAQRQSDLRWIREPFLDDETDHGFMVIHGHTIRPQVEERANRIGIDTGAYRTNILTAVALDGAERWFLDTRAPVDVSVSATH